MVKSKKPKATLLPPPTIDPLDPGFRAAWQEWTTSALGRLDQLPKLDQNQLSAIARAAAGDAPVLGIDLPASLAALFEAKLTLDREKAKLVRMQKELQGYRCECDCHDTHCEHAQEVSHSGHSEHHFESLDPEETRDPEHILRDPERLDAAVASLFNWIKQVVYMHST